MSKKFKGKTCVYCGAAASEVGDHVVARQFFSSESRRIGLPKVPACTACNTAKSSLENYLMSLLPFGSSHESAREALQADVGRRLERNKSLSRELSDGQACAWLPNEVGLFLKTTQLPVHEQKVSRLFEFIAKGLLWHHWQTLLGPAEAVVAMPLTDHGVDIWWNKFFAGTSDSEVQEIAGGGFQYLGRHSSENPQLSVWMMQIYGGVAFTDRNYDTGDRASWIGAITGPQRMFENAARIARWQI